MKVILFNLARDAICHCADIRQWANLHRKETKGPSLPLRAAKAFPEECASALDAGSLCGSNLHQQPE